MSEGTSDGISEGTSDGKSEGGIVGILIVAASAKRFIISVSASFSSVSRTVGASSAI